MVDATNELLSQISASAVVVALLNHLKQSAWVPFINANSKWVNRLVAGVFAVATSLGMHFSFDADIGTLTVTGLTAAGMAHSGWEVVKAYVVQHYMYKAGEKATG